MLDWVRECEKERREKQDSRGEVNIESYVQYGIPLILNTNRTLFVKGLAVF
jgi:hypothetical protein